MRRFLALLVVLALAAPLAHAQQQQQRQGVPQHNLQSFEPPNLPMPNDYRAGNGAPGADYWQNHADYEINATLRPEENRIEASETITYTNNSPQELEYLWVQLDQNLFDPESEGAMITRPDDRFSGSFEGGGYDISGVSVEAGGDSYEPEVLIDGTKMRVTLDEPLAAGGGQLRLSLDFAFTIPKYGADRMGRYNAEQGTVYQLAQWYPRMYVFDDVNGWNVLPYLGQGEYYLEYGDFDLNVTVPRDMIVSATGSLQNDDDVLTDEQRRRMSEARNSDETVTIISRDEVGTAATRPDGDSGMMTWEFDAENVRDVSWAASASFIWDAARAETGDGSPALAQSLYPQEGIGEDETVGWEHSTQMVQHSIEHYSDMWGAYPYPVAVNVAGVVAGMEYPQIVFCDVKSRGQSLFGVTDHEFGHQWFPMVVGSDERRHAWMDEGLNTFMNYYSKQAYYDTEGGGRGMSPSYAARAMSSPLIDQPIMTYADRIRGQALGFLAYRKPAQGLVLLREYILGEERFDSAFREYYDRWAYQHPQPADFFRTIEDVAGADLDWFWTGWFYSTDRFDQGITSVETEGDSTIVTIENQRGLVMPATVAITYEDGETEQRRVPVEAFFTSDTFPFVAESDERSVERVRLDPNRALPDVDRSDDAWRAGEGVSQPDTGR